MTMEFSTEAIALHMLPAFSSMFPSPCPLELRSLLYLEFSYQEFCSLQFIYRYHRQLPIHTVVYFAFNKLFTNNSMNSPSIAPYSRNRLRLHTIDKLR